MSNTDPHSWSITLTPHRSLTRGGFIAVMVLIAGLNLVWGIAFAAIGAWPVLGFMGLDVVVMWWAFKRNFADSEKAERIIAEGDAIILQRLSPASRTDVEFNRRWLKVELEHDEERELVGRLFLRSHGQSHEIASFLGAEERLSLARALRRAI
ncbi:MAG: DUF2244 domain-containing protein [Rhizobiales bacterium]|nr:DUF2244 domain-containing protein [Hyphomicrobiales bacterium]